MLCLRQDILHSSSNCNSISGGSCLIFCHTVVVSRRVFLFCSGWFCLVLLFYLFAYLVFVLVFVLFEEEGDGCLVWGDFLN